MKDILRQVINITEKDIFNFVFLQNLLPEYKAKEISSNYFYRDKIDFYEKLKKSINSKLPNNIKDKLSLSISTYISSNGKLEHQGKKAHDNDVLISET